MANKGDFGTSDPQRVRRRYRPGDIIHRGRQDQDSYDRYQLKGDGSILGGAGVAAPTDTGWWSEPLTVGECPRPRVAYTGAATSLTSQTLYLTYFRCARTEPVNSLVFGTASTGAADDPTVVRYGLWTATEDGALTGLVASTPNDAPTTMLASTQTRYPKAISEVYTKVRGQFYAVGILVVSATTMPNMYTIPIGANNTLGTLIAGSTGVVLPRVFANVASQSDLPATVAVGGLSGQPWGPYCEII